MRQNNINAMDKNKLDEYKNKLEAKRTELLAELKKDETPEDFGTDVDHGEEEANEAESFSEKVALGQSHKEQINDIDVALSKFEAGKFGICEKCGREIEDEVLRITPESRFCKGCKKETR